MLIPVPTVPKSLEDYRPVIGDEQTEEIYRLAEPLKGAKVLHVNATAFGGGVAELLGSIVPLTNDLGLSAQWQIIQGADEFYKVTKALHNSLQGMHIDWTAEMWDTWCKYNILNAEQYEGEYDFVVVHDPQPAGLLHYLRENGLKDKTRWIWRCHIDSTDSQPEAWAFLRPYVEQYDAAIFTLKQFVKPDLEHPQVWVFPPAIDPLSPKNVPLPTEAIRDVLTRFHVDPERPMILQASRMDAWKDPLGVLEAYYLAKQTVPGLQMVYLAAIADDDPEGWEYYNLAVQRAGDDPDIFVLPNVVHGIGDTEVNAFQSAAKVVLQKSLREGFSLSVSEALWKGRPVVGSKVGGIPLQVIPGKTGYLVESVEECAQRITYLLQQTQRADQMGQQGREHVRQNFLITRYLRDFLRVFNSFERGGERMQLADYAATKSD